MLNIFKKKKFNKYSEQFDRDKVMKEFHKILDEQGINVKDKIRFCFVVDDETYFSQWNGLCWSDPIKITKLFKLDD